MREASTESSATIRGGTRADAAACLALWVTACTAQDGAPIAGDAERARPKFTLAESWIVAENPKLGVVGFLLTTTVGSGLLTDPSDALIMALLAVTPGAQGRGLGNTLVSATANELAPRGHERALSPVLAHNHQAVRLYESQGWQPPGETFQHSLMKRLTRTYVLGLR